MACLLPGFPAPSTFMHPHRKLPVLVSNSSQPASNSPIRTAHSGWGLETIKFEFLNLHCFPKSSPILFSFYDHVLIWLGCIWKEAALVLWHLFGSSLAMPHLCSNRSARTVTFPIFPLGKLPGISEEQHEARLYRLEHTQFVRWNWQY